MTDSGYGKTLYGSTLYGTNLIGAQPKVIQCALLARIVKPLGVVPPLMDTIVEGLVERFDWLQQSLQSIELLSTIEYAPGRDPERPDDTLNLDDAWGKVYSCPRLTGESDADYRTRLQTRTKILTGCGTAPNIKSILDYVVGIEGSTEIESRWPAQAWVTFNTPSALRIAKSRQSTIETLLPDLFAAGIASYLQIPFTEISLHAAIIGDAALDFPILAAIQGEPSLSVELNAVVALGKIIDDIKLYAAIQAERTAVTRIKTAISGVRTLSLGCYGAIAGDVKIDDIELYAAVAGDRSLSRQMKAAIQAEQSADIDLFAAISKVFSRISALRACIKLGGSIDDIELKAAIQADVKTTCGLKARIARRI